MKLPKQLQVGDRVYTIKRRKKVVVDKEKVRGAFSATKGTIEVEKGLEEFEILRHEAVHADFERSGLAAKWCERQGKDLAEQLEEEICDTLMPLYRETLKRNGLT